MGLKLYLIDTETTGLSADKHEIIQVSVIRVEDRHQLSRNIKAEHPETASFEALRITGKTHADLLMGDSKEKVVEEVDKFLLQDNSSAEARVVIGHNIHKFDRRFLQSLWAKTNRAFLCNLWLDTIPFTKKFALMKGIESKSFNLETSLKIVGIKKIAGLHNAIFDSQLNYKLWMKLIESGIDYLPFIKRDVHIIKNDD